MWGYLIKGFRFIVVLGLLALAGQVFTSPNASVVPLSSCPGDFDGNWLVNIADFLAFMEAFGSRSGEAKYNAVMDMDGSGAIDISDFLVFAGVFGTTCQDPPDGSVSGDRKVLVALYNATDGQNWVNNENWLTEAPLEDWYGVATDESGRVTSLALYRNALSGVIPPELGNLANLQQLRLVENELTGLIPPKLGDLAELRGLNLSYNLLTGPIPPELGNLTELMRLDLTDNPLSGSIPPELGNLLKLSHLAIGFSRLFQHSEITGPIPPELGKLTNLRYLFLRLNQLTGLIPSELGDLAGLRGLNLGYNQLTGLIPSELGDLAGLRGLNLGYNQLTGPIPPELGDLTGLEWLMLQENELTGPIPPELGDLAKLQRLRLDWNFLTGPIPPGLANLGDLTAIHLQHNQLDGPIPPRLADLTNLRRLHLGNNQLTGPIPPELGDLTGLEWLTLGGNRLSGPIPPELGNLVNLTWFDFADNPLTGSLPRSFIALRKLEFMDCRTGPGVCAPATDEFRAWVREMDARGNAPLVIPFCDAIDKRALEALYEVANGSSWTRSDGWLEDEDLSRWHGIRTDAIGRVSSVDLSGNGLSGHLPEALRLLASMTELRIGDNALTGRLPLSLAALPLEEFDYAGTSLCLADDADFRTWLNGIARRKGTEVLCPPLSEREILESLYRNMVGQNWNESAGWLTDAPLAQWHGVETDAGGRVVALRLPRNGLGGLIPAEIGELSALTHLDLGGNRLEGSIPGEIGELSALTHLGLGGNRLEGSIPGEIGELSKLRVLDLHYNALTGSIPAEIGELSALTHLHLQRNRLSDAIPREIGRLSELRVLELGSNNLFGSIPREVGDLGRLTHLGLQWNHLSGEIPEWIGRMANLTWLNLDANQLTGRIPEGLGRLRALWFLSLSDNKLAGPIPSELGRLANLTTLMLSGNDLSGSVPPELGRLPLRTLDLGDNGFTGPLPGELGHTTTLGNLDLGSNALAGPLPPEFGNLTALKSLILADNPDLAGPLPSGIAGLGRLERLMAGGTGLCRPADASFDAWFRAIPDRRLVRCAGGATVYLTQTVQSWDDPVPLLAGESALLRVFVTAAQADAATMPSVRATFYVDGAEQHVVHIPASAQSIPTEITEGDLALSVNEEIPDWVIVPGLEMVIEVDPEGTLDAALGVTKRIPESGRMAIDVRPVPPFRLTLIPVLWDSEPDLSLVESVAAMAADPDGHELLRDTRTLLPVVEFAVTAHTSLMTSSRSAVVVRAQVRATRLMEGGSGYWMGLFAKPGGRSLGTTIGLGDIGGHVSVSVPRSGVMAHELGHNLRLSHAPCGGARTPDPWFPDPGGRIGAWGYDFEQNELVTRSAFDLMSYCKRDAYWVSDYFFNKALNHRLAQAGAELAAGPTRTLLLWGGRDKDGVPSLDPAFVVDAVPALPPAGTEYAIVGADSDGVPLFSYSFDMPEIGDAEGEETSFVFALPVQAGWADDLVSITLSGLGGSATLDESTDRPMAILRDQRTGQVRGFLSDLPSGEAAQAAAKSAVAVKPGVEVLFSRGIPDLR